MSVSWKNFFNSPILSFGLFLALLGSFWLHWHKHQGKVPLLEHFSEFHPTELVVISEQIVDQFVGAKTLVEAILEAKSRLLILTRGPLDENAERNLLTRLHVAPAEAGRVEFAPILHESYWVRDFSPIATRFSQGAFDRIFLSSFRFRAHDRIDDSVGYQFGLFLNLGVIFAPIVIDGGNFLKNGSDCIVSSGFALQDAKMDAQKLFHNYFGCQSTHIIQDSPHDHVDMFLHFVTPNTVMVNAIALDKMAGYRLSKDEEEETRANAAKLDRIAEALRTKMEVIRAPMPVMLKGLFRTYTNMLIVNKTAILPRYARNELFENDYPDAADLPTMEQDMEAILTRFGYQVRFVPADDLIAHGGAIHCLTSEFPH